MPSDWRVDKAWEFAASALRSALVRLAAPVSRMLTSRLVKSCRFCTTERFEPKVELAARSVSEALPRLEIVALMSVSSRNLPWPFTVAPESGPIAFRLRPSEVRSWPWMSRLAVSFSLKAMCSLLDGSPFEIRLMPLKLASLACCVICVSRVLNWSASFLRPSTPATVRSALLLIVSLPVP